MWGVEFRTMTVVEEIAASQATGILSPGGQMIYKREIKNPIGFVWFNEEQAHEEDATPPLSARGD